MTGRSFGLIGLVTVFATLSLALSACAPGSNGDRPQAEYDRETGRLRRLTFDLSKNGRNDTVSVMDGTRIDRIELDLDEDGHVDRWDFYRFNPTVERVGFSRLHDGVMDAQAFYGSDRRLTRIEQSTARDGRFNRVEYYEGGVLVRSEVDTNYDGRTDKWETYRPNRGAAQGEPAFALASVAFDDLGIGSAQRRVIYDERGRVVRVDHPQQDRGDAVDRSK